MHGLMGRALQCFLRDTYGAPAWREIAMAADLGFEDFEPLLTYSPDSVDRAMTVAAARLKKPSDDLLEDLGTYLVSHRSTEALRRLLRFGGPNFIEFLYSLDDLAGRARLAVPELILPRLDLTEEGPNKFLLTCELSQPRLGRVLAGIVRAMADDYGTLALLSYDGEHKECERILLDVHDSSFTAGRRFDLGAWVPPE